MTCENQFCIYWKKNACILSGVHLDIQGACTDCLYVELPEALLERERQALLRRLGIQRKE